MFSKLYILAALSATALAAVPAVPSLPPPGSICGIQNTPEIESISQEMLSEERAGNITLEKRQSNIVVNTYMHVVSASSSTADGNVPSSMIDRQMQVLNDRFAPHGISFILRGTDRTINANWADYGDEEGMKRALRRGTYGDLNLYILRALNDGNLGTCRYPYRISSNTNYWRDGCSVVAGVLPGGSYRPGTWNNGIVGVHEVGHWFGLYHTFEGDSCSGTGDLVDDTPQSIRTSGCPSPGSRDSCPDLPGFDPVANYMDYSTPSCRTEFTPGQETRMYNMWSTLRNGR